MSLNLKKLWLSRFFLALFLLVVFWGFFLRFNLALNKVLWVDEVFYFDEANSFSFKDILLVNRWIKDNPPLFLIFLKIWSFVSKNILWIRLPGLLVYLFSTALLVKLFEKLYWSGRLIIIAFFAFSPFFITINYWVTPFNFVLLLTLLQFNLLVRLIEGKYFQKETSFIAQFSLINFLLFSSHYSSIFVFLSYPVILIYLLATKSNLAKTFLISNLTSYFFLIPNTLLLLKNWSQIEALLVANPVEVSFTTMFHLFLYLVNLSILRFGAQSSPLPIPLVFLALGLVSLLARKREQSTTTWLFLFIVYFILPGIFLFLFYQKFPSIFVDRTFQIFHLGFYFLLAYVLSSFFRLSKSGYLLLSAFLLVVLVFVTKIYSRHDRCFVHGDVLCDGVLGKENYDLFIDEVASALTQPGGWTVVAFGDNPKNGYQNYIFTDYYFAYDTRLSRLKGNFERGVNFFVPASVSGLRELKFNSQGPILLINFDERLRGDPHLVSALKKPSRRLKVIDFWDYHLLDD